VINRTAKKLLSTSARKLGKDCGIANRITIQRTDGSGDRVLSEGESIYKVGDSAQLLKTVKDKDIRILAEITGDNNPLHLNDEFASKTIFKKRIAHGIFAAGLISAVIGTKLPGNGTIYLSQTLNFLAPVYIGDTVTARVEVLEVSSGGKRLRLKTQVINQHGTVVVDGEAFVVPPRK